MDLDAIAVGDLEHRLALLHDVEFLVAFILALLGLQVYDLSAVEGLVLTPY